MHPRRSCWDLASRQISSLNTSINSALVSGRPLASRRFNWFHTPSSGFNSGARRGKENHKEQRIQVSYKSIISGRKTKGDITLQAGDTIVVP